MKNSFLLIAFLMIISGSFAQSTAVNQVASARFNELITENNGILLDVRTAHEFKNGHIPNAGNLNYYAFDFRKKLALLPEGQPIYLYCNTGYRSEKAARFLIDKGYTDVYNLQHGIMEWELVDLTVVMEPDASPDTENKMDPERYYAIIESEPLVFFDFYAPWCGPCRKMMPMIDSLKVDYHPQIRMYKVNVDASKKLVKELQLVGVPYLTLFHNGNSLFTKNGVISRQELTTILDKHIRNHTRISIVSARE